MLSWGSPTSAGRGSGSGPTLRGIYGESDKFAGWNASPSRRGRKTAR
jgi:hypothetical protein